MPRYACTYHEHTLFGEMVTPMRNGLYVKDGVRGRVRAARRFDTPDDDRFVSCIRTPVLPAPIPTTLNPNGED